VLEPVARQVASVQEALQGLRDPDLTPVLSAVYAIDGRQDLIAVESRITAIEYSLAALHHMVRTRVDPPARPEPNWSQQAGPQAAGVPQTWPRAVPSPRVQPAAVQPFTTAPREAAAEPLREAVELDPIAALRRPDDRANLLVEPAFGPPDDLEQINGVGPILASLLRDIGVYYFWQVAEWTPEQAAWVDSLLQHFRGRIRRDDWVGHARLLASMPNAARRPLTRQPRRSPI
jgi:predicted flap endonuclease-1-like 5' DNA nuclease